MQDDPEGHASMFPVVAACAVWFLLTYNYCPYLQLGASSSVMLPQWERRRGGEFLAAVAGSRVGKLAWEESFPNCKRGLAIPRKAEPATPNWPSVP